MVGLRVTEPHLIQPDGDRRYRTALGQKVQFVYVGHPAETVQHSRQRPPPEQRDDHDADSHLGQDEPLPVVQQCAEKSVQVLGGLLEFRQRNPRHSSRNPVHIGGDRVEDQVAQPGQHGQRQHHGGAEDGAGHRGGHDHGGQAAAMALDDAGQAADVGAIDHSHKAAHAGDQERDSRGGDGGGNQHANPVAVSQQPHRHRAQQRQTRGEGHHDSDDRRRRAQRRHHSGLRNLEGLHRPRPDSV